MRIDCIVAMVLGTATTKCKLPRAAEKMAKSRHNMVRHHEIDTEGGKVIDCGEEAR